MKFGIASVDAVAIGDTPYDVSAAGKAGIATICVLCGGFAEASLRGGLRRQPPCSPRPKTCSQGRRRHRQPMRGALMASSNARSLVARGVRRPRLLLEEEGQQKQRCAARKTKGSKTAPFGGGGFTVYFSGWLVPGLVVFAGLPSSTPPSLRKSRPSLRLALALLRFAVLVHFVLDEPRLP